MLLPRYSKHLFIWLYLLGYQSWRIVWFVAENLFLIHQILLSVIIHLILLRVLLNFIFYNRSLKAAADYSSCSVIFLQIILTVSWSLGVINSLCFLLQCLWLLSWFLLHIRVQISNLHLLSTFKAFVLNHTELSVIPCYQIRINLAWVIFIYYALAYVSSVTFNWLLWRLSFMNTFLFFFLNNITLIILNFLLFLLLC